MSWQQCNGHILQLQVIQPDVESFLLNELKPKCTIGLVGGSDFQKIAHQMGGSDEGMLISSQQDRLYSYPDDQNSLLKIIPHFSGLVVHIYWGLYFIC